MGDLCRYPLGMKKLISAEDILTAANLKRIKVKRLTDVIMKVLKLDQVNQLYENAYCDDPNEFIDRILDQVGVQYKVRPEELERIPKEGAFIAVSNHPYGGIDGLILMRLLGGQREDAKVMANYLLERIIPLRPYILPVNPFDPNQSRESSMSGMKLMLSHLRDGHPLGIFPAGEVSSLHKNHITDRQWNKSALKLMQRAEVPIVPIYFKGRNSVLFHLVGMINPAFRTAKLPSELLNKQDRTVEVRIGTPIKIKEQQQFKDVDQFGRYIRSRTYALGSALEVRRFFKNRPFRNKKIEPIQEPQDPKLIAKEMRSLGDHWLFDSSNFSVYSAPSHRIPNVLKEIGRLREITYRQVGEGTNHALDLDEFDLYYHQLVIWDREAEKIVGGYRIGLGKDIMHTLGIRGFYLFQLFKLKRPLRPLMEESLELGRSFIIEEYQRKPLPLFLLWKGILVFLLKNPGYRYLTGPVSISNQFSGFSKGVLIEFLKKDFYNGDLAKHIRPRKKFRVNPKDVDINILLESSQKDLSKLDKIIQDIEPMGLKLPVLFKKYIKQNARIVGFNLDPKFNNALDGMMILDIYDVPSSTIISLMKEMNDDDLTKALFERNLVA